MRLSPLLANKIAREGIILFPDQNAYQFRFTFSHEEMIFSIARAAMVQTVQLLDGGTWRTNSSSQTDVFNPSTAQVIAKCRVAVWKKPQR